MKRCSRIISLVLALALLTSLFPTFLVDTVFAEDNTPKYVVSSNVEWASSSRDTTKPFLKTGNTWIKDGTLIDYSTTQGLQIANYTKIADNLLLDYIEVDGLKIYRAEFEKYNTPNLIDTSSCPNLKGRTVRIRLNRKNPQIQFDEQSTNSITQDIKINVVFKGTEDKAAHTLKADSGEHGKIYETKWLTDQNDGSSLYALYVRPDYEYQLKSYITPDGVEHILNISTENYVSWRNPDSKSDYDKSFACEYFEISIKEDTSITLNYAPATMELVLWSYKPQTNAVPFWGFGRVYRDDASGEDLGWLGQLESNSTSVPLIEDGGAKFYFKININGFLEVPNSRVNYESFKLYKGTETTEENLLLDSSASGVIQNATGFGYGAAYGTDGNATTYYFWGKYPGAGSVGIVRCPELKQITAVVQLGGKELKTTADVQMTTDVPEVKEFLQYYRDTYGMDKMGQEAYTDAEKQTDAYKLYCQYSSFRYELRTVYREQAQLIAAASDPAAALETAKAALDAAAKGEGCNAVSWSFNNNPSYGTHSKPTLTAIPNDGDNVNKSGTSAADAMCAALEAEYPGNWSFNCTSTQFGLFVNSVTAGGESDTGKLNVRASTNGPGGSYGFWYYNGKFSEWGVSNYYPYDGDVMAWGNPDVEQTWNQAILRFHYKNNGGDTALEKDMEARGVTFESTTEELQKAFPDINFSRYGQFRDVSEAERVIQAINAIGAVSPDSGDAIDAARKAYDALSEEEKAKVYNYQTLLDAEAAYNALTDDAGVTYDQALVGTLAALNKNTSASVGSTKGEWMVLALARGGIINGKDTDGIAPKYLSSLSSALGGYQNTTMPASTDYSRATLATSALGVDAPASVLDVVRDYNRVTTQGINAVAYALLALDSKPYDSGDTTLRNNYVAFLLNNACDKGGWVYGGDATSTADVDMTAMVIQALAPYYGDDQVQKAVNSALKVLKSMQKSTGGFSSYGTYNAESTAQVIVALTALNIDPTSWTQKNGNPVSALLHFYDSSSGMFRHTSNGKTDQMATEQSAYALVAYNRFLNKQNSLYNMSDAFSESGEVNDPQQTVASAKLEIAAKGSQTISMTVANTPEEVKAYVETLLKLISVKGPEYSVEVLSGENGFTAAVAGTEESPYGTGGRFMTRVTITMGDASDSIIVQGKITTIPWEAPKEDITVSFQLLGDTHHEIKTDADIHTYRFNADELPVWIDTVEVTVPAGSTVGDVFKQVMDEKGYTYVGLEGGYIGAISQPNGGISLTAKDDSRNDSGWMYLVNGKHANVGLNSYTLSGGEVITWHWCDDFTIEEGSENWNTSRVIPYIENLIKLIGEVDASDACKARIDKARAAYDKLTEAEQAKVSNYQTLQDAEAKYKSLTGMDALVSLIEEQTWTVSMNDANDAAAVKAWLEAKLNTLELNGAKVTATVTDLTAATAGTADNKSGTDGSFTFDVTLTVGEDNAQASRSLTGLTGTITATKLISSDAGVASVSVGGKAGTINGNTIIVVLDYADDATIPSDSESVVIVTNDPAAQVSDLTTSDEGVTWTFTVTAEDGTTAEYTIHVSIAENPAAGNIAAVAAAKSMLENASFTYASKDVNSEAAAKAAVEDQIKSLLQNTDVSFDVTMTGFTAAQDGTAENESGANGSFSFTVKLTKGEAETSAEDSVSLTGTITAAAYVKSTNAGVAELTVAGETATISGNSFTVTVPYGTTITAESFKITLADSKASVTTLPHEENGVWSFTVTAEDGTAVTYTVTVTVGKSPDQTKADEVIDLINGIGTVTKDSKDKIDAARKAYDSLDKAQKDLVTNYPMLTEAEKAYADLVKADQDKAQEVIDLINGIGTVTKDSGDKIDAAREAYDKLTEDQKELVPEGVRKTLTDAEEAYKDLTDPNPPTPPARETYTLTFNTNGGSELPAVEFKAGTKVNLKDYITIRTGFKFLGWYSDPDFRHKVTTVKLDQDITVYAKWSELPKDSNGNTSTGAGVTSQNTGDAGITLYVGMSLIAVLGGALVVTRKRKEN